MNIPKGKLIFRTKEDKKRARIMAKLLAESLPSEEEMLRSRKTREGNDFYDFYVWPQLKGRK